MCRRHSRITAVLLVVLAAASITGAAQASNGNSQGNLTSPQPLSNADQNPGGANGQCPGGPYCSTRDGSPSLNGNGSGDATGKPCAGCVGKADNKNPQGQMPGGSDANNGYECDGNNGIGKGNPAHTSCKTIPTPPPPVTPPVVPPTPPATPPTTPPIPTPASTPTTPAVPAAPQPPVTPTAPAKGGIIPPAKKTVHKKPHKAKKHHKKPKHHARPPKKLHFTP
jgi:hypothetical protein